MASKRLVKKYINQMIDELVVDCLHYMKLNPDKSQTEIAEIVSNALKLRGELIFTLNSVKKKNGAKAKDVFNTIIFNLIKEVDRGYTELSKLPR